MSTFTFIPSPANPIKLSSRYEIRQLTPAHLEWSRAILTHSNVLLSPIWPLCYPENKIRRVYTVYHACDYLVSHQINSGLSFGVFDTEYKFKRPESAATGGKLYWDENDLDVDSDTLLEQMDFPLCSIALSYDLIEPLDMPSMGALVKELPLFATIYAALEAVDQRDPAAWKAKEANEVLMRNGTSTRGDYEGEGLMKKLAQWLMREAALKEYRGIQIECGHDAVNKVWMNPPAPFKADVVGKVDLGTYTQENAQGDLVKPFKPSTQLSSKIYVTLVSYLRP